jgi:hypothetical protein
MTDSEYRTTVEDEHWRNEEFQWARILAQGRPAKGMVLLYLQKACTAFHEFEPAFEARALDEGRSAFTPPATSSSTRSKPHERIGCTSRVQVNSASSKPRVSRGTDSVTAPLPAEQAPRPRADFSIPAFGLQSK